MKRFFTTGLAASALALTLAGCFGSTPENGEGEGNGEQGEQPAGPDVLQMTLDSMKGNETSYVLALPPGAAKGTWWEHTQAAGGNESKIKYVVVDERDGLLIVEKEMPMGENGSLVEAWAVDPSADLSKVPEVGEEFANNVKDAWIGKKDGKAEQRPVMKVPVRPEDSTEVKGEEPETGEESVELGGKSWDAKWTKSGTTKMWMAKDSTFMLKMEAEGSTMELTGFGTDGGDSMMKWE